MSLKAENLPDIVKFFTSPAWADLFEQIKKDMPLSPPLTADALHTASQFRIRQGFELCLTTLLREAGVTAQEVKQPLTPEEEAIEQMKREGSFINTSTD